MHILNTTYEKGEIKDNNGDVLTTWEVCVWNGSFPVIIENVLMFKKEHIVQLKKEQDNKPMLRFLLDRWYYNHVFYKDEYSHWIIRLMLRFVPYYKYGNVIYKKLYNRYYIYNVGKFDNKNPEHAVKIKRWKMKE
jgi:hypothetical protein